MSFLKFYSSLILTVLFATGCMQTPLMENMKEDFGNVVDKGKELVSGDDAAEKEATNQNNLKVYSGENRTGQYILEGTIYGAATAVAANCGINLLRSKGCMDGAGKYALGGAAVGALSGYLVASTEDKKKMEAEELQSDIDRARIEIAEATVATEAARELAAQRTSELQRLKTEAGQSNESAAALKDELAEARGDLESMRISSRKMNEQIAKIEKMRTSDADKSNNQEYQDIIAELKTQRAELDEQIAVFDTAILDAGA